MTRQKNLEHLNVYKTYTVVCLKGYKLKPEGRINDIEIYLGPSVTKEHAMLVFTITGTDLNESFERLKKIKEIVRKALENDDESR